MGCKGMSTHKFYQDRIVVEELHDQCRVVYEERYLSKPADESGMRSRLARKLRSLANEVEEGNALEERYPGIVTIELKNALLVQPASQWYGKKTWEEGTLTLRIPRGVA